MATTPDKPVWALWNLIFTILTGVIMITLFITYFVGKKRREDEEDRNQAQEKEEKEKFKRMGAIRLLSFVPTIVAIVFFILTEDMRNTMVLTDRWTLLMFIIALIQVVVAFMAIKRRSGQDDDKDGGLKQAGSQPV